MAIFAEYNPETVQFIDENSCTVRWTEPEKVVQMFLGMTKMLQRVRTLKKVEDGELVESDEEEEIGQVKEENGDDIAVVGDVSNLKKKKKKLLDSLKDVVEINVEEVKIPPDVCLTRKWRVVTKHVPGNFLLILRYATGFEIRCGVINSRIRPKITFSNKEKQINQKKDESEFGWVSNHSRVRPGLNVFDEKGNELEWDYEHDTRFFKESSDEELSDNSCSLKTKEDNNECSEKLTNIGKTEIRSRGRGTKKFLAAFTSSDIDIKKNKIDDTLASDTVLLKKKRI